MEWDQPVEKVWNLVLLYKLNFSFVEIFFKLERVFTNGPGDLGSIPGHVIPKTLKMVLDTYLLHTQQYKVCIKSKVAQSWERCSTLPYTSV